MEPYKIGLKILALLYDSNDWARIAHLARVMVSRDKKNIPLIVSHPMLKRDALLAEMVNERLKGGKKHG